MKRLETVAALKALNHGDYYSLDNYREQCTLEQWLNCLHKRKYKNKPRVNQQNVTEVVILGSFRGGI